MDVANESPASPDTADPHLPLVKLLRRMRAGASAQGLALSIGAPVAGSFSRPSSTASKQTVTHVR